MKINKTLIISVFVGAPIIYINLKVFFENLGLDSTLYFLYILIFVIAVVMGVCVVNFFVKLNKKKKRKFFPSETDSKYIYHRGEEKIEIFEREITKRKEIKKRLKNNLIRIPNERLFDGKNILKKLDHEIIKAKTDGLPLVVIMIDFQNFKDIALPLGDHFEDDVLNKFADTIINDLRKTDYTGKTKSDEFIIILPNTTLKKGELVLSRIKNKINSAPLANEYFLTCFSASILGVHDKNMEFYDAHQIFKSINDLMHFGRVYEKTYINPKVKTAKSLKEI
ncbi:diguanylate cyclase [uncultured Ilyobacter sp.]|uniref:GGDEF domain-containing protein n=1 Tax=uncultured Ilyobacter sp. TaxID=544433 RepID=UPI0029F49194|nr:diguanylate cyclase [uncultured Ilyobacter sp.]